MRHSFDGKPWTIRHVEEVPPDSDGQRNLDGLCDYPKKTIYIHSGALMECEIHEAIHALEPGMTHAKVFRLGRELTRFLRKLGYRKHGTA
jgi:hypothetical protein